MGKPIGDHDALHTVNAPRIRTTTVGSYPAPDWLRFAPSEQAIIDATRVIVATQRQAGIDLPTDGEVYRFDLNHPDTNGMIDYFVRPLQGVRWRVGRSDAKAFAAKEGMQWRGKPAGVVEAPIAEGSLDLVNDCARAVRVAGRDLKFTVTSPFMLARTLLDHHYTDLEPLVLDIAKVLAKQVAELQCACVQIDEANITGNPEFGPVAALGINTVLDAAPSEKAVHFCFGNYGGQVIQRGTWKSLVRFLNSLRCDHLILELAHRPDDDLKALKDVKQEIGLGIGVIDVKVNPVETPDEVARRIETAEKTLGENRVKWVHPDCGLWMLPRSVADRKIVSLVQGRDRYLGLRSRTR